MEITAARPDDGRIPALEQQYVGKPLRHDEIEEKTKGKRANRENSLVLFCRIALFRRDVQ